MASCFIPYVLKPTNKKHRIKQPCKNVPKQPIIVDSGQQIEQNSVPIRAPAADSDLLMHKVNTRSYPIFALLKTDGRP